MVGFLIVFVCFVLGGCLFCKHPHTEREKGEKEGKGGEENRRNLGNTVTIY